MKTIYLLLANLLFIGSIYSQVDEEDVEQIYELSQNWDQAEYIIANPIMDDKVFKIRDDGAEDQEGDFTILYTKKRSSEMSDNLFCKI